jgi:hypothetical protein
LIAEASDDEGAPIGPGAEEEAFMAEEREAPPPARATAATNLPSPREEAPAARLDDLVARIPEGT